MNSDIQAANRRAAWRWGGLIVGLLGLQVTGGVTAVVLSSNDPTVGIVPDYHQKALHWDDEVALREASRALGWKCDVSQIDEASTVAGLRVTITDRDTTPVELAEGELTIYRHARASEVSRVRLPAGVIGMIKLDSCFDADGLWQVSIDVTDRNGNRFVHSSELNITLSKASLSASVQPARGEGV